MNLYLESSLASHRHGRFFISQLNAQPADELPANGLLLMHGQQFQERPDTEQTTWWQWACQAGCALLLIPPFKPGEVFERLDWQITNREDMASSNDGVIPRTTSSEVTLSIAGIDGDFDLGLGHQWIDYSVNTRFVKQHNGTGVFAITTLPLWSISLLDHSDDTIAWLEGLRELAGSASEDGLEASTPTDVTLEPTDYTLLVCIQAWGISTAYQLSTALSQGSLSLFSIPEGDIVEGIARLKVLGLINDAGLTDTGVIVLKESPYEAYLERLKEESPL